MEIGRQSDGPESNRKPGRRSDRWPGRTDGAVRFEGTDYEIDLNAKNAAAFSKQLAPYLEHARKAGRAQARRTQPRSGSAS
jgi:hypothetical protein